MPKKIEIAQSSGNVFADLGISNPETALAKAELAARINTIIKQRGLNQTAAGKLLGIDQAKVSALARGHLSGFSTDRLFRFINALGSDVKIVIEPKPASRKRAHIRVADL